MAEPGWRVSAVIPAYNRANLLPETITSLLRQTVHLHEIIVVDDGSADETAAVVAGFGARVRYIRIENSGAPAARNVGARAATGDWLWFCDSDDLWRPTYLERCRAIAVTAARPRFIFGNFRLVVNGHWRGPSKFETAPDGFWSSLEQIRVPGGRIVMRPLYGAILSFQPVFHSTIVMSRDLFDEVGGYDEAFARVGSEDFEFTLRCMAHAPVGVVDEPLVGIRRHAGNFSGDHLRVLMGEVAILRHAKAHHAAASAHAATIDREIGRRSRQALDEAFALDDYATVADLARTIDPAALGPRRTLKVFLASLPVQVRAPIVSAARIKNREKTLAR